MANSITRRDPTQTLLIRQAFLREIFRRFEEVKKKLVKGIVVDNILGLPTAAPTLKLNAATVFDFPIQADKLTAATEWMQNLFNQGIIGTAQGPAQGIFAKAPSPGPEAFWANTYLTSAYKVGMKKGFDELKKKGYDNALPDDFVPPDNKIQSAFNAPFHSERVRLIYQRAYSQLKGITQDMDTQISQIMGQGMIDGRNPKELAKQVSKSIDNFASTRAATLARTEVVRAHHTANISVYRQAGVEGVTVEAEWSTAGDDRVCPRCEKLAVDDAGEERIYTLDEIQNLIPAHPNCRCAALPLPAAEVIPSQAKKKMQEWGWLDPKDPMVTNLDDLGVVAPGGLVDEGVVSALSPLPSKSQKVFKSWSEKAFIAEQKGATFSPFSEYYFKQHAKAQDLAIKQTLPGHVTPSSFLKGKPMPKKPKPVVEPATLPTQPALPALPAVPSPVPPPPPAGLPNLSTGLFSGGWTEAEAFGVGIKDTGVRTGGSTGATIWKRDDGSSWNVKFYQDGHPDQAPTEWFANKVYQLFGIPVPESRLIQVGKQRGIATRWIDGTKNVGKLAAAEKQAIINSNVLQEGAPLDMWLGNWDWAGLETDNILYGGGQVYRIDQGGTLWFRAQGSLKGESFGNVVNEISTMRDSGVNAVSARMYGKLSDDVLAEKIKSALETQYNPKKIKALAEAAGFPKDKVQELTDKLENRRQSMIQWSDMVQKKSLIPAPVASKAQPPSAPLAVETEGVTAEEWGRVAGSRGHGYSIPVDLDQFEDQNLLFWLEKDEAFGGKEVLRASWKFRDVPATKALFEEKEGKKFLVDSGMVDRLVKLDDLTVSIIKSMRYRLANQPGMTEWDPTVTTRVNNLSQLFSKAYDDMAGLRESVKGIPGGKKLMGEVEAVWGELEQWKKNVDALYAEKKWNDGWGVMAVGAESRINPIPLPTVSGTKAGGIPQWKEAEWEYRKSRFDRGYITRLKAKNEAYTARGVKYEGDGVSIQVESLEASKTGGGNAGRGWGTATIQDTSPEGVRKFLKVLQDSGINTKRAAFEEMEEVFLTQWAYRVVPHDALKNWDDYTKWLSAQPSSERVANLKKLMAPHLKKPLEEYKTYKSAVLGNSDGAGFGVGRRTALRPDMIEHPKWEQFQQDYRLMKGWTNSEVTFADGIAMMLDSGGTEASQMERIRKGISAGGMSLGKDLRVGGAHRNFLRLRDNPGDDVTQKSPNRLWFHPRSIARVDTLKYDDDYYGETSTSAFVREHKTNTSLDALMKSNSTGDNEVMFKDSLSLIEDIWRIVAKDESSRQQIIQIFRDRGYTKLNGMTLEEVILAKSN